MAAETGDDNVHYQNFEALVNELIVHNKQLTMIAYPNRSHGISEDKNTTLHVYTTIKNLPSSRAKRNFLLRYMEYRLLAHLRRLGVAVPAECPHIHNHALSSLFHSAGAGEGSNAEVCRDSRQQSGRL